jgi:hypothetical protein
MQADTGPLQPLNQVETRSGVEKTASQVVTATGCLVGGAGVV